jgi:FtsP/CotA-like multicopper oxidase with cupredoxin domain
MSITWSPDRPGNWLFHCHWAIHLEPDSLSAASDDPHHREMIGLALGVSVGERTGGPVATQPAASRAGVTRRLRLVAVEDTIPNRRLSGLAVPSMHFVLDERGHRTAAPFGESPELDLVRGQPVEITVVNHLDEPTSVHWHGIEVEDSYVDGVGGFSGAGARLAPEITPGDSFVARFTPPRSGTFMYHSHVDETRQQRAGMVGALIVLDPGVVPSADEHVFLLNGAMSGDHRQPVEINGTVGSDTVVVSVGRPARLRMVSLAWANPTLMFSVTEPVERAIGGAPPAFARWTPIAKDGFDLPAAAQIPRAARHVISMGETYDFVLTPPRAGMYALTVGPNPPPGVRVPDRVLARVVIRAR